MDEILMLKKQGELVNLIKSSFEDISDDDTYKLLQKTIQSLYPQKTVVDICDVENELHQTYKSVYEIQKNKANELNEQLYSLKYQKDLLEMDMAALNSEYEDLKASTGYLKEVIPEIINFIHDQLEKDSIVSENSITAVDSKGQSIILPTDNRKPATVDALSLNPGIYNFKRPNWFKKLNTELSKDSAAKKSAKNTQKGLLSNLFFQKKFKSDKNIKNLTLKEKEQLVDVTRRKNIAALLKEDISNEEKYLKYILLTPGVSKDYLKTLNGAADLNIDANIVIELLEQPKEYFNWEMIEAYISKVHKGNEYNLKQELAKDLLRGEWYVNAEIDGSIKSCQLVPMEYLTDMVNKLNKVCEILEKYKNGESLCLVGTSKNDISASDENIEDSNKYSDNLINNKNEEENIINNVSELETENEEDYFEALFEQEIAAAGFNSQDGE